MEMLNILGTTSIYAACLGIVFMLLSFNVIRLRWKFKVGIGGGHKPLDRAIRVHGNFSEYVALVLLLIALYEISGASDSLIHFSGASLLIGRCLHAIGLTKSGGPSAFRIGGMGLTFTSLAIASIGLLINSL
tara:strand:+ start:22620 stop:23015 length:396 start_codon:yes stop_codon:yes gene_type:complete